MKAKDLLAQLVETPGTLLADLPALFGIYALRDHRQLIRYIGCTYSETMGFKRRIGYHKSGNEGQSHKFSQAYCTGRLWRYKKTFHGAEFSHLHVQRDANVSKKLRNKFIERYCSASYVALNIEEGSFSIQSLKILEGQVQSIADPEMRKWESKLFREEEEPIELIDTLIDEGLCLDVASVERQNKIYRQHIMNR